MHKRHLLARRRYASMVSGFTTSNKWLGHDHARLAAILNCGSCIRSLDKFQVAIYLNSSEHYNRKLLA